MGRALTCETFRAALVLVKLVARTSPRSPTDNLPPTAPSRLASVEPRANHADQWALVGRPRGFCVERAPSDACSPSMRRWRWGFRSSCRGPAGPHARPRPRRARISNLEIARRSRVLPVSDMPCYLCMQHAHARAPAYMVPSWVGPGSFLALYSRACSVFAKQPSLQR